MWEIGVGVGVGVEAWKRKMIGIMISWRLALASKKLQRKASQQFQTILHLTTSSKNNLLLNFNRRMQEGSNPNKEPISKGRISVIYWIIQGPKILRKQCCVKASNLTIQGIIQHLQANHAHQLPSQSCHPNQITQ